MKKSVTSVRLSASDLSNHLACRHLTMLDLDVATGGRSAPAWNSPDAQILQERGIAHVDSQSPKAFSMSAIVLIIKGDYLSA
jgi:hypothetical protein